ncbi:pyridoxal-phosphate dependent enzyme [Aquamicrobium soli]|uniref:Pyridoxal-phosphate dependent enzyme n=1 Tax=Aquamicrobium soli TaxID=1811518 RepID=A0ABV7K6B7_9HYPH
MNFSGGQGLERVRLVCAWCGAGRPADLDPWCHVCGGSLVAENDGAAALLESWKSFSEIASLLPAGGKLVSLGEGNTPLVSLARLCGEDTVHAKADWMNPTGSFKDRGAAVAVSAALGLGAEGVVCASTGNNATSVSAYAARAGLPCIITLSSSTPASKVAHARAYGATLVEVDGTFSDAYHMAEAIRLAAPRWANLTSTYANPYMTAAHATIFYELCRQLGSAPGTIIVPIGAGPMLGGILQGAEHLLRRGEISRLPVLVGVQSAGCAPIARAFEAGRETVEEWTGADFGIAGSINDPLRGYPADGTRTLRDIRRTGGFAVAVEDTEIQAAMSDLARYEGIAAEPAAAAPLAALRRLIGHHDLPRPITLVISGHALKDPGALPATSPRLSARDGKGPLDFIAAATAYSAGTLQPPAN